MAIATISDVAEKAGVSKSTVSHVLNATRFVEPETEGRVREAMRALKYRPNSLARSLRRQETKTIGLLLPDNLTAYWTELSCVIVRAGYAEGYTVLLGNSDWSIEHEREYVQAMLARQLDGIILSSFSSKIEVFDEIAHAEVPVVAINTPPAGTSVSAVMVNNRHGGCMAGEYLAKLGHRQVGLIASPTDIHLQDLYERVEGFRQVFADIGFDLPDSAIFHGDFEIQSGEVGVRALFEHHPDLTAVFAVNDNMAMGAIKGLRKLGRRVPDDVSVIGFDNILYASAISPGLTTIGQPITDIGQTAFRLLRRCMQDAACTPEVVMLEPTLIVRESCRGIA